MGDIFLRLAVAALAVKANAPESMSGPPHNKMFFTPHANNPEMQQKQEQMKERLRQMQQKRQQEQQH